MKKYLIFFSGAIVLGGCVSNQPFTPEEIATIQRHNIVVEQPAENEQLFIFSRSAKTGSEVAGAVLGVLTGSFGYHSDGDTPRTRLEHNSNAQFIKVSQRKAAAEKLAVTTPTKVMTEKLAVRFSPKVNDAPDSLTVSVKPVAWHLYYDKFQSERQTYLLEYASDIKLSLPAVKLSRQFECDHQSDTALTKEEWIANNNQQIKDFANKTADSCIVKILEELGQK